MSLIAFDRQTCAVAPVGPGVEAMANFYDASRLAHKPNLSAVLSLAAIEHARAIADKETRCSLQD
jgi:hypothetical protein